MRSIIFVAAFFVAMVNTPVLAAVGNPEHPRGVTMGNIFDDCEKYISKRHCARLKNLSPKYDNMMLDLFVLSSQYGKEYVDQVLDRFFGIREED